MAARVQRPGPVRWRFLISWPPRIRAPLAHPRAGFFLGGFHARSSGNDPRKKRLQDRTARVRPGVEGLGAAHAHRWQELCARRRGRGRYRQSFRSAFRRDYGREPRLLHQDLPRRHAGVPRGGPVEEGGLKDVYDSHFVGNYGEMALWLKASVEANYGNFLDVLGLGGTVEDLMAMAMATKGPAKTSTGTSGASSPKAGAAS